MELSFEKDELLFSLQVVQGVASERNTLPILQNVLIRAENGKIEFSATDLEVGIRVVVIGTIKEEGSITVSAKKFTDLVRELPSKPIELATTANDRVELTCGEGVYKMIGLSDEDFPEIPSVDGESIIIDGNILNSVIHKTEFAASRDEVRYLLNSLYFNILEDKTEIVATDGTKQLALTHCDPLNTPDESSGFIVPLKAVREIERTFAESGEVKIALAKNQLLLANDNTTLTTRLVEGEYANYQGVIPESSEGRAVVTKELLLRATRRVALLSNPKNYLICLEIDPERITISANSPELGEARESVEVESSTGSVRIGVDARVLTGVIEHIETDSLIIEFSGEFTQFAVKPQSDDTHTCIIMPMRLES